MDGVPSAPEFAGTGDLWIWGDEQKYQHDRRAWRPKTSMGGMLQKNGDSNGGWLKPDGRQMRRLPTMVSR